MGVVGTGKSTLRSALAQRFLWAQAFAEWPDEMPPEVRHALATFDPVQREAIQAWIFRQLARKNELIHGADATLAIIDRSPVDTFAFYEPSEWQARAKALLNALAVHIPVLPVAPGALLLLWGDAEEIAARMEPERGYTAEMIEAQQAAFERMLNVAVKQGISTEVIDVRGKSPEEVADCAAELIQEAPYYPADLHGFIESLAGAER